MPKVQYSFTDTGWTSKAAAVHATSSQVNSLIAALQQLLDTPTEVLLHVRVQLSLLLVMKSLNLQLFYPSAQKYSIPLNEFKNIFRPRKWLLIKH
jgi:hypothetical protein